MACRKLAAVFGLGGDGEGDGYFWANNFTEMSIITKELLDLATINEQERLLSQIKKGGGDHFALVRMRVRIVRFEKDKDWGPSKIVYENEGFRINKLMHWKWFFRYRQAIEQAKTPKQLVQVQFMSYVPVNRDELMIKVLKDRLSAAKGAVTKIQGQIERAKIDFKEKSLFSIEDEPKYAEALQKLGEKIAKVEGIEKELEKLTCL